MELDLAIKKELEKRTPWAKICHKFRVGTARIKKVQLRYLPGEADEVQEGETTKHPSSTIQAPPREVYWERAKLPNFEGEVASKVFRLLRRNTSPDQIVEKLQIDPQTIENLEEWYLRLNNHEYPQCDKDWEDGYAAGAEDQAKFDTTKLLMLPCTICGEEMTFDLSKESDRGWALGVLNREVQEKNWAHSRCIRKRDQRQ